MLWWLLMAAITVTTFAGASTLHAYNIDEFHQTLWWIIGFAAVWLSFGRSVVTAMQQRAALIGGIIVLLFSCLAVITWLMSAPIA
jgi:hypothetical protein